MIRIIDRSEAILIHELAEKTWPDTFKDILESKQIRYMLDWMYNVNTLEDQLENGHTFAVIEEQGKAIGFIGCQMFHPTQEDVKIHKIYILPEAQGTGAGKKLMTFAYQLAKENGLKKVKLNVNRFNNAVSFYKHLGFIITLEEDIDIGGGYLMEDYRMELEVK